MKINIVEILTDDVIIGLFSCKWKSRMSQLLVNLRWHHSPRQQNQGSRGQTAHDYNTTFPGVSYQLPITERQIADSKEYNWKFSPMVCAMVVIYETRTQGWKRSVQIYRKQALKTHPTCQSGLRLTKSPALTSPLIRSWPLVSHPLMVLLSKAQKICKYSLLTFSGTLLS